MAALSAGGGVRLGQSWILECLHDSWQCSAVLCCSIPNTECGISPKCKYLRSQISILTSRLRGCTHDTCPIEPYKPLSMFNAMTDSSPPLLVRNNECPRLRERLGRLPKTARRLRSSENTNTSATRRHRRLLRRQRGEQLSGPVQ